LIHDVGYWRAGTHPRLRERLSRSGDGPGAIGHLIIRHLEGFSAGHAQFDDITLIRFGPVPTTVNAQAWPL
jgi:hypothetical protein